MRENVTGNARIDIEGSKPLPTSGVNAHLRENVIEPCRCVYPDKCFCPPEAKTHLRENVTERPGFLRWLLMGRAAQDAYCVAVLERRGFSHDEAIQGAAEVRAASRGIPYSPWLMQRLEQSRFHGGS